MNATQSGKQKAESGNATESAARQQRPADSLNSQPSAPNSPPAPTLRQMMEAREASQAIERVVAEVRQFARGRGAKAATVEELSMQARLRFRVRDGVVVAVASDGRTVLQNEKEGRLLSVRDWCEAQVAAAPEKFDPLTPDEVFARASAVPVNPWRKESWNVTLQMRLRREDPEYAGRLAREARESGSRKAESGNAERGGREAGAREGERAGDAELLTPNF